MLINEACPEGADRIAEMFWTRWGGKAERYLANWTEYGRSGGFRRAPSRASSGLMSVWRLSGSVPTALVTPRDWPKKWTSSPADT